MTYKQALRAVGLASLLFAGNAFAEQNWEGFDSIVDDLKSSPQITTTNHSPFDDVWIHAGLGYISSMVNLQVSNEPSSRVFLQGVEAYFGIDLFSPYWLAEGAIRSLSPAETSQRSVSSKEFDLRVIYHNSLSRLFGIRLGTGLSARYLTVRTEINHQNRVDKYATPASLFLFGLPARITQNVSIGPEFTYRAALVTRSIDRSALDGSLRLSAQF